MYSFIILPFLALVLSNGLASADSVNDVNTNQDNLDPVWPPHPPKPQKFECKHQFKKGALNVHVVAHTHDDPGWLKTVDEYYLGTENQWANAGPVQYILNTVVAELWINPQRRFSYCEMSYFWRWWQEQNWDMRSKVKKLIKEERLQFIGGGWVQSDEAASHYQAFIDQMSYGLRKIRDTFGEEALPIAAWQIDPFGHSRGLAEVFHRIGYESLFFARLHYNDYNLRKENKSIILNWNVCPADTCGEERDLLTSHFFEYGYGPPGGLCWDQGCDDEPIIDDPRLEGYNLDKKVKYILEYIQKQAASYKNDHFMFLMGNDFNYPNANKWFSNIDKMIKHVDGKKTKDGRRVNIFYSTPNCYTRALQMHKPEFWGPKKEDDFFPYGSDKHTYWGGYFTSRPTFKGYIRDSSNLLQHCKIAEAAMHVMGKKPVHASSDALARAVALAQHHDGVSGTAKQHTTDDYMKRLYEGAKECGEMLGINTDQIIKAKLPNLEDTNSYLCQLSNISICNVSQSGKPFFVTVANRMGKTLNENVRIPLNHTASIVFGGYGKIINSIVLESFPSIRDDQLSFAEGRAPFELQFQLKLPPMGSQTVLVIPFLKEETQEEPKPVVENKMGVEQSVEEVVNDEGLFWIENDNVRLEFNRDCEAIKFSNFETNQTIKIKHDYVWYKSASWVNPDKERASGAYIFRPNVNETVHPVLGDVDEDGQVNDVKHCSYIQTEFSQEVRQTIGGYVSNVYKIWANKPYVEIEWTVGPLPNEKLKVGHEVVMRFDTNIRNRRIFYTDANGRQIMTRARNYQATYPYENGEPAAGNYYPVNTRIGIFDKNDALMLMTDRSHGGSSLKNGQMELMLHRRCFFDDRFGVGEPLNEKGPTGKGLVVKGRSLLVLTRPKEADKYHRHLSLAQFQRPLNIFTPVTRDGYQVRDMMMKSDMMHSYATYELPANVNLLTLEQFDWRRTLIRFEHTFAKNEDPHFSKPAIVNLKKLFVDVDIEGCEELALAADRPAHPPRGPLDLNLIVLKPFDIRTFVCHLKYNPKPPVL